MRKHVAILHIFCRVMINDFQPVTICSKDVSHQDSLLRKKESFRLSKKKIAFALFSFLFFFFFTYVQCNVYSVIPQPGPSCSKPD